MKILAAIILSIGLAFATEVYFSPGGGCTEAAVREINKAEKQIAFEAYNFTSPEILNALQQAVQRGVRVRAIYDRSQRDDTKTLADELAGSGVGRNYGSQKIMHDKVLIIDQATVVTGSFNFTTNAERFNAENMVVIHDAKVAAQYLANFEQLLQEGTK
ncbi:MAG: phospholipase D-like domain-containing protein [Verrucomicrobiota bacterium]